MSINHPPDVGEWPAHHQRVPPNAPLVDRALLSVQHQRNTAFDQEQLPLLLYHFVSCRIPHTAGVPCRLHGPEDPTVILDFLPLRLPFWECRCDCSPPLRPPLDGAHLPTHLFSFLLHAAAPLGSAQNNRRTAVGCRPTVVGYLWDQQTEQLPWTSDRESAPPPPSSHSVVRGVSEHPLHCPMARCCIPRSQEGDAVQRLCALRRRR